MEKCLSGNLSSTAVVIEIQCVLSRLFVELNGSDCYVILILTSSFLFHCSSSSAGSFYTLGCDVLLD